MPEQFERPTNQAEKERSRERRESKEQEMSPELAAAATKERADYLVREVKTGQQQMQNILHHMAQVKSAIAKIRAQLALAQSDDDAQSLSQDQAFVDSLKKQIAAHKEELINMKEDLIKIHMQELAAAGDQRSEEELRTIATAAIEEMMQVVFAN